ncbi:hypothetical protein IT411_01885, partial [Candidatus Peregrinibacteria bacterium]|nr:hypothetical protein [Candidatus Peregrinibacteria bacterium]
VRTQSGCSGIYYQTFGRFGYPLTQPKVVDEDCSSAYTYTTPDVATVDGLFAITYVKTPTSGASIIVGKLFNMFDNLSVQNTVTINDGDVDPYARPRITGTAGRTGFGPNFGITFQGCRSSSCDDGYDIYFQELDFQFNRSHPNNIKLNDSGSLSAESANIAFSNDLFMITWQEENTLNQPVIMARSIDQRTFELGNTILISASDSNESSPDITASPNATIENCIDCDTEVQTIFNFLIAYSKNTSATNSTDVMVQKITCDDNFNTDTQTTVKSTCALAARNGQTLVARASNSTNSDIKPAISSYKNFASSDFTDTTDDYFTVAWLSSAPMAENFAVKARNFTRSLTQVGSEINVASDARFSNGLDISSSQDGNFTVAFITGTSSNHAITYPTEYLKRGNERLINSPDSRLQDKPAVAVGPNGNYVVTYESNNGNDSDTVFALYDSNNNPIKNINFTGASNDQEETDPKVSFFKDDSNSTDYGKFIIMWKSTNLSDSGIQHLYYRIFNADGTPEGSETMIDSGSNNIIRIVGSVDAAKNRQFIFAWKDYAITDELADNKYQYHNGANVINGSSGFSNIDTLPGKAAISPKADGSITESGTSKFVLTYNPTGGTGRIRDGYLATSSTVTLNPAKNSPGEINDISAGFSEEVGSTTDRVDEFFYAFTYRNSDFIWSASAMGYKQTDGQYYIPSRGETGLHISIDPNSNNIAVIGKERVNYTHLLDPEEILYIPVYETSNLGTGSFYTNTGVSFDITRNQGRYAYVENSSGTFPYDLYGVYIGYFSQLFTSQTKESLIMYFTGDVSSHFTVDQTIEGLTSGATGTVKAIDGDKIIVEDIVGFFQDGEDLDNSPFNDNINSSINALDFYIFGANSILNVSDLIYKFNDYTTYAEVAYVDTNMVVGINPTGTFNTSDETAYFNRDSFTSADQIFRVPVTFSKPAIIESGAGTEMKWLEKAPSVSVNQNFYYGQTMSNVDVDYNTSSANDENKLVATTYAISNSPQYLDNNGVYEQTLNDPFSTGTKEDLSPTIEQQITSGGKYIIVPQTIDFGNVNRGTTAQVNFADLSPACLQVTDLDGTDFDLTVSMTNLSNTTNGSSNIPNTNFVIENNDGINPDIQTNYSFTSASDVQLDASTDPGENANLGTTQTLLRKFNNNTGSWTICPKGNLDIPSDALSGTYSGTITFTLI